MTSASTTRLRPALRAWTDDRWQVQHDRGRGQASGPGSSEQRVGGVRAERSWRRPRSGDPPRGVGPARDGGSRTRFATAAGPPRPRRQRPGSHRSRGSRRRRTGARRAWTCRTRPGRPGRRGSGPRWSAWAWGRSGSPMASPDDGAVDPSGCGRRAKGQSMTPEHRHRLVPARPATPRSPRAGRGDPARRSRRPAVRRGPGPGRRSVRVGEPDLVHARDRAGPPRGPAGARRRPRRAHRRSSAGRARPSPARSARRTSSCPATTRRTAGRAIRRSRMSWRSGGVAWHARRGNLVHEPEDVATGDGRPFSVYSPFRRAWERLSDRGCWTCRRRWRAPACRRPWTSATIPSLAELGLGVRARPRTQPSSRSRARPPRAPGWSDGSPAASTAMRPAATASTWTDGTSRLSADLRFGLLSPLEVVERAVGAGEGRRIFLNELVWREFYAHVLFHRPAVRRRCLPARVRGHPVVDRRGGRSTPGARAGPGYPVVDAAMRQLAATGWMHNRARMIAASFLTKDLLIDWRAGEAHFMRELVDGDVASNNGGWQWSASTGTDPQPYFRIFNPVAQGRAASTRTGPTSGAGCRSWRTCRARASTRRGR